MTARLATPADAAAMARIYNQGEVGVHQKHACLDGVWRDVVVVERLIPANLKT